MMMTIDDIPDKNDDDSSSSDYAALYSHCDYHGDDNAIKTLAKKMMILAREKNDNGSILMLVSHQFQTCCYKCVYSFKMCSFLSGNSLLAESE